MKRKLNLLTCEIIFINPPLTTAGLSLAWYMLNADSPGSMEAGYWLIISKPWLLLEPIRTFNMERI